MPSLRQHLRGELHRIGFEIAEPKGLPLPSGAAAKGVALEPPRADHVHPSEDSGWITPTLINSWVNYDANAYAPTRYRKIGDTVYITGLIKSGTVATGAFNLPVGYRPYRNLHFATATNAVFGILEIKGENGSPAGDVHVNTGSNVWYSLECSFMIG